MCVNGSWFRILQLFSQTFEKASTNVLINVQFLHFCSKHSIKPMLCAPFALLDDSPYQGNELSHVCLLAFPGMLKRRQQQREAVKSQVQVCMFCFVILSSYLRCLFFNIPEVSLADLFLELSST
jgi:hypothetical protein